MTGQYLEKTVEKTINRIIATYLMTHPYVTEMNKAFQ